MKLYRICVFCGANKGNSTDYITAAKELGAWLGASSRSLVYGGGKVGLMGVIADAVLSRGGEVIGVIPDFLMKREVGHTGLSEMIVVETMHERKQKMADLSDGFIAMPGGWGTLDELAEILTWAQLQIHQKPIGILNANGYFDALLAFMDHMVKEGFLKAANREMLLADSDMETLIAKMEAYEAPNVEKWIDSSKI